MDSHTYAKPSSDTSSSFKCTIPISPPISNKNISTPTPAVTTEKPPRVKPKTETPKRHTPFSNPWVAARLKDSPQRAISILRMWAHPNRHREVNDETIRDINGLSGDQATEALNDLKKPHVFVQGTKGQKLEVPVIMKTLDTNIERASRALIDSGCEGSCINTKVVEKYQLPVSKLHRPIPVYNADGSRNLDGSITGFVTLQIQIGGHNEQIDFGVTSLGNSEIFLGHDWLKKHNPSVDWKDGSLQFDRCPTACNMSRPTSESPKETKTQEVHLEDGDRILMIDPNPALNIRAKSNIATDLATKENQKKEQKPWKEQVPNYLHDFADVFDKEKFEELPPHRPWDHAIKLLPGTTERLDCKIYPLSNDEQTQLDEFLEENLSTGRIRPSKSLMASPFFFIKKKDGKL